MSEMPLAGLIRRWWSIKQTRAELEAERSRLWDELTKVEQAILDQFVTNGMTHLRIDAGDGTERTFYLSDLVRAQKADDSIERDDIVNALMEAGLEELCPRGFNWNQLHAYARELRDQGAALPEPLARVLTVHEQTSLGSRSS